LSFEEWRKLLAAARGSGLRDEALMLVIYDGGLRASEVSRLTLEHCQRLHKGMMYFHRCKGSQSGWFVVTKATQQALLQWIQALYPSRQARKPGSSLFPGDCYLGVVRPLSRHGVYRAVKRLAASAGLTEVNWPHALKHGRVAHLVEQGLEDGMSVQDLLPIVAKIVGHRSAWTTIANYMSERKGAGAAARRASDKATR
jgi:site-specific recombinase XerD